VYGFFISAVRNLHADELFDIHTIRFADKA
jgi:hypothetical protein